MEYLRLFELTLDAVTGLDAIKRAPIVDEDTGIKCIRIQDISQKKDYIDWGNTKVSASDFKKTKLVKDDILVARTGATVGVSYFVEENLNAVFNNGTIRLRLDTKKIDPYLVYSLFQTREFRTYIDNISCVATQPNLRIKGLLRYMIPVFGKEIQKKITLILFNYNKLIKNNNKRIKVLENIAEELYKEWFVRFRFPGFENITFKCEKPIGWIYGKNHNYDNIPITWKYSEFQNIGTFVRGKNITASEMIEGEVPVISAGLEPSGHHNNFNVTGPSITISASGANAGYLSYHQENIWAADCSYYSNEDNLWFAYNTLKFLQPVITNMQVGSAQPHVYAKNINKLTVLIPDDNIINLYEAKVKPLYEEIKILTIENKNLMKQRDSLLPRLICGKLSVEGKEII